MFHVFGNLLLSFMSNAWFRATTTWLNATHGLILVSVYNSQVDLFTPTNSIYINTHGLLNTNQQQRIYKGRSAELDRGQSFPRSQAYICTPLHIATDHKFFLITKFTCKLPKLICTLNDVLAVPLVLHVPIVKSNIICQHSPVSLTTAKLKSQRHWSDMGSLP